MTPNAADHCLGGTILLELGLTLPDEGVTVNMSPDRNRLSTDAMRYLRGVQYAADGFADEPPMMFGNRVSVNRPWGEALEIADRRFHDGSWDL